MKFDWGKLSLVRRGWYSILEIFSGELFDDMLEDIDSVGH